jgi:hypothetical protein
MAKEFSHPTDRVRDRKVVRTWAKKTRFLSKITGKSPEITKITPKYAISQNTKKIKKLELPFGYIQVQILAQNRCSTTRYGHFSAPTKHKNTVT